MIGQSCITRVLSNFSAHKRTLFVYGCMPDCCSDELIDREDFFDDGDSTAVKFGLVLDFCLIEIDLGLDVTSTFTGLQQDRQKVCRLLDFASSL